MYVNKVKTNQNTEFFISLPWLNKQHLNIKINLSAEMTFELKHKKISISW